MSRSVISRFCRVAALVLLPLLVLPAAGWAQSDPVPQVLDWTTDPATGLVHFQIRWSNTDTQPSNPVSGTVSSQPFGVYQQNHAQIGDFTVPSLAVDSFFDIFYDIALTDLPPSPQEMLPGGGPQTAPGINALADSASCPPDDHWDGNVDVSWTGPGTTGQVGVHYGSLLVCPGAGASYIHVRPLLCNSPVGATWTITDLCPGFNAVLVNEDFTPAPAALPFLWSGWICVTAAPGVPIGVECCPKVVFDCDGGPAEITLCATTCDWSNPPDPVVSIPDWTTNPATGTVTFQLHWENPNPQQASKPVSGTMASQAFGVFQPDFGPIGSFNVPSLAPDSFFDVFFDVDPASLPPAPQKTLPGGGAGTAPGVTALADSVPCPPDDHWDGNVDVIWTSDGLPAQVNVHYGSLQVCPGGGASYIHIPALQCNQTGVVTWQITDLCAGFSATLVNEDFTPAPAGLPPSWTGWICVTAGANLPSGTECCPKVTFTCEGEPAEITLCATTCDWNPGAPDPVVTIPDWTTDPATGIVTFQLHWENPDPTQASHPAFGTLSAQQFGVFQPNAGVIGSFEVPPIPPLASVDSFFDIDYRLLPAPPQELLPGGGPPAPGINALADSASCPPDDHWDGNVDVFWTGAGTPAQVNVHYGTLRVCPGAGNSYIHIPVLQCNSGTPVTWSISDVCPGFTVTLVNQDFSPAPSGLPPAWEGWICVSAGAGVPIGIECCPKVTFDCDGQPAEITLCATTCDWSNGPDPVVVIPDWTTNPVAGTVQFQLHWENTNPQQWSKPVSGTMASQEFGVFLPDFGPIGSFNVPSLAPDSFFDVFFDIPLSELPPQPAKFLPGGGAPGAPGVTSLADSASCPPGDHWDGNVDVVWTSDGLPAQVNAHYGSLMACPGGGASYVHIPELQCNSQLPITWVTGALCPGFNLTLVNEDFTPAPGGLPPNWSGWICVTADSTVAVGVECCPKVIFNCDGVPAEITLCITTCDWSSPPDPVLTIPDWTTNVAAGTVRFTLHWTNPSSQQFSNQVVGQMSSQRFGVFQPDDGLIGNFNVPPLAPDSFFDVFFDVSLQDLPPQPQVVLPGGGPGGAPGVRSLADSVSCPPNDHWDGNVDVVWLAGGQVSQVNVHYGDIRTCPGAGASYIHIPALQCDPPNLVTWSIADVCSGFTVTLVNEDFSPAPAMLPTGWTGWICITADAAVPVGTLCCPRVIFDCAGVPAEITLCTQTCSWTVGGIPGDRVSAMSLQARPNPTLGSTTVGFVAPEPGEARIEVFSTSGRLVRTLLAGPVPAGIGAVSWNGRDDRGEPLSSGVYLVRLSLAGNTITRKVSLLSN